MPWPAINKHTQGRPRQTIDPNKTSPCKLQRISAYQSIKQGENNALEICCARQRFLVVWPSKPCRVRSNRLRFKVIRVNLFPALSGPCSRQILFRKFGNVFPLDAGCLDKNDTTATTTTTTATATDSHNQNQNQNQNHHRHHD